jgi:hypothetical protein
VFEALASLDTDSFRGEGRVYGGGLFKMEPKELAAIPADFLLEGVGLMLAKAASLFGVFRGVGGGRAYNRWGFVP